MGWRALFKSAGLGVAATLGGGIFALPYVIFYAGWFAGIFYFLLFGFLIGTAHTVYFKTLKGEGEKQRLVGLLRRYFGKVGFFVGLGGIVMGLLLALLAFLILGGQFLSVLFPSVPAAVSSFVFWVVAVSPILFKKKGLASLELFGVAIFVLMVLVVAFISLAYGGRNPSNIAGSSNNWFFAFGPVFFAMAGWTAVEPVYEFLKKDNFSVKEGWIFYLAEVLVILIYVVFVGSVFRLTTAVTPNVVSGLALSNGFLAAFLAAMGCVALLVSYELISLEVLHAIKYDLNFGWISSLLVVVFTPFILLNLGLTNFLSILGVVGGVFIGTQYLAIIEVGRRALNFKGWKNFGLVLVSLIFLLGAVYEVYYFVVR